MARSQVRQCDVRCDDFPAGSFDLIHARLVLEHLPDWADVIRRMTDWLAPGGWLFFEEPDTAAAVVSPNRLWVRHIEAYVGDPYLDVNVGRKLPAAVSALGLVDVDMELDTTTVRGGTDLARWYAMTIEAIRPGLVASGGITSDELDEVVAMLDDPSLLEPGFTFVGVWGRKPR
jgi:SAM-dependent methyltransferase